MVTVSAAIGLLIFGLVGIPASLFFRRLNIALVASAGTVLAAWMVAAMAGFPPPAIRAAGIATVYVAARFVRRGARASAVVAVVAVAEMLIFPLDATTISFQLSYAAVYGILMAVALLPRKKHKGPVRILFWARNGLVVSAGASAATLPLTAACFGSVPLVGPVVNLLVIPIFSFFCLPGAFLSLLALFINPALTPGAGVAGNMVGLYGLLIDLFIDVQGNIARIVPDILAYPPFPVNVGLAAGGIATLLFLAAGRGKRGAVAALAVAAAVILIPAWRAPPSGEVVFFNVGKGDAALIRCPSGENWLVDAGPPMQGRLLRFLADAGVRRIDGVIVTHPHEDHFGGIPELVAVTGGIQLAASLETIRQIAPVDKINRVAGGRTRVLVEGQQAIPGCGLNTEILALDMAARPEDYKKREKSRNVNNDSLVFRLGPPGTGVLFMGDLEISGEKMLLERHVDLRAAVLKVGHHGSAGASHSDFLAAVTPNTAIISGWPSGPRSAPGGDVLARFLKSESKVMATALLGTITVDLPVGKDGKTGLESVFKPQNAFLDGFGGFNAIARAILSPVKVD